MRSATKGKEARTAAPRWLGRVTAALVAVAGVGLFAAGHGLAAGRITTVAGTANVSGNRCTSATLMPASPINQPAGSTVAFMATASGCTSPQFEYWIGYSNGTWQLLRGWGAGAFNWVTNPAAPGTYTIHVWANQVPSTTFETYASATVNLNGCASATLTPPTFTGAAGSTVAFTASSTGCANAQFEYWIGYSNGTWAVLRTWGPAAFSWVTNPAAPGTYTVHVWANNVGDSTTTWEAFASSTVTLTSSPPTISGFSPTSGSVGTTVVITGSGFTGTTAVAFNGKAATYTVTDDSQISTSVPAGATTGPIEVTTPGGSVTSSTSFTVAPPHIMLIVMENKAYDSAAGSPYIIGNSSAPYINNTLVKNYTLATHWYANEPNSPLDYYDLISGSNQSCCTEPYTATTVVDELNTAKIPWKAYMESMPSNCYTGLPTTYYSPVHNPFAAFSDYQSLCTGGYGGVVPYNAPFSSSQLETDLNSATPPNFVWFTPNICDDMHTNGTPCGSNGVVNGDTWLSTFIPDVQGTSWYTNGGIIIITWDESVSSDTSGGSFGTGGHIVTLVISDHPKGSFTSSGDHFAVLRAIEEEYVVGLLGGSANASFGDLKPAF